MLRRHLSAFLIIVYSLFCVTCLLWSADQTVRTFKHAFFYLLSPGTIPPLAEMERWGRFGRRMAGLLTLDRRHKELFEKWQGHLLDEKRLQELEAENARLTALLNLTPLPAADPLPARLLSRDPHDWFHSILVDRGKRHGVCVSDPVTALQNDREVFVGQVIETEESTAQILLLTDPLSSVSARLVRTQEEGAVEGGGGDKLLMNYLFSDTDVRPGDEVVTAGLGRLIPGGVFFGTVQTVEEASRKTFRRAVLNPAVRLGRLKEVLILRRPGNVSRVPKEQP